MKLLYIKESRASIVKAIALEPSLITLLLYIRIKGSVLNIEERRLSI